MLRRLHLACFFVLIGMTAAPLCGAAPATVSGLVCDSGGVPQIGAAVELLRPDLSVVARVYTNGSGRFAFAAVSPGHYSIKAMGSAFLPSLRENIRVHTSTIVNLTLNTLYEAIQWLPAQPRAANGQKDDWTWTLRSAADRPLLRWLEDGPLIVVSDGPRSRPKLKARLVATGQRGTFGEDGQRISAEVENTPSDSRELLARVDFDPSTSQGMESMLGFRQDLGFAGSVQSVAAITIRPDITGAGGEGLNEASIRSSETMNFGDMLQAEAGAEQVIARFSQGGDGTVVEALPFVTVGWRAGDSTLRYRLATAVPQFTSGSDSPAGAELPAVSMREGKLVMERGFHQEISWERSSGRSAVSVAVFADEMIDPVLQAMAGTGADAAVLNAALYDANSRLLRIAGPGYTSAGVVATVERRLPRGNDVRLSYANGNALVMQASQRPTPLGEIVAMARPRRAQMYALALSGTLEGSRTHWRASYRWQSEDTVTPVASYQADAAEPFFTFHLRQPVYGSSQGVRSLDAMLDMRNLLGQGQQQFVLTDGSLLLFAQNPRSVSAGLAFTF